MVSWTLPKNGDALRPTDLICWKDVKREMVKEAADFRYSVGYKINSGTTKRLFYRPLKRQYRFLKPGETIRPDDEIRWFNKNWTKFKDLLINDNHVWNIETNTWRRRKHVRTS